MISQRVVVWDNLASLAQPFFMENSYTKSGK